MVKLSSFIESEMIDGRRVRAVKIKSLKKELHGNNDETLNKNIAKLKIRRGNKTAQP